MFTFVLSLSYTMQTAACIARLYPLLLNLVFVRNIPQILVSETRYTFEDFASRRQLWCYYRCRAFYLFLLYYIELLIRYREDVSEYQQ